jgi:hypothetical protein
MTEPKPVSVISPRVFGLIMAGALLVLILAFSNYFWTHGLLRGHGAAQPYPYYLAAASAAWFGVWLLWLYYRRSKGFTHGSEAPAGSGRGK